MWRNKTLNDMKPQKNSFFKTDAFKLLALISFLIGYVGAIIHSGDMGFLRQELILTGGILLMCLSFNYLSKKTKNY